MTAMADLLGGRRYVSHHCKAKSHSVCLGFYVGMACSCACHKQDGTSLSDKVWDKPMTQVPSAREVSLTHEQYAEVIEAERASDVVFSLDGQTPVVVQEPSEPEAAPDVQPGRYEAWEGLRLGDKVKVRGERGTFKFLALVVSQKGQRWVEVVGGHYGQFRSFPPERDRFTRPRDQDRRIG